MIDDADIHGHRERALTPEKPVLRGSAQNPDVYFQGRETVNPYYTVCPEITQKLMDRFGDLTGRRYKLYEYVGAPDADRVIVIMGSGAETVEETSKVLNAKGEKTGVLKVRMYRPFDAGLLLKALPSTVKRIAVLDRTKEPGANGEPLYLDVVNAVFEATTAGGSPFKTMPSLWWVVATAFRQKNLRRAWPKPCLTTCRRPSPRPFHHRDHGRRVPHQFALGPSLFRGARGGSSSDVLWVGVGRDGVGQQKLH
jgi:hypothetical protein